MFWKDKIVLLTGASSGIGEGLAVAIAKKRAIVGLLARREEMLRALAEKCESVGAKARVFACDVVDAKTVQDSADALREEFGRIDILIANAGIGGNNDETRNLKPEAVKKVTVVENKFFANLDRVTNYEIKNGKLFLMTNETVVLEFEVKK